MTGAIVIVGCTSAIGRAVAHRLASAGRPLILLGRGADRVEAEVRDIRVRHDVEAWGHVFDAERPADHGPCFAACLEDAPLAGMVICHGLYVPDDDGGLDWTQVRAMIDVNLTSLVTMANLAAEHMAGRGEGFICGISSVAGVRGRRSNALYGAAKAGVNAYLSGLRQRLHRSGVHVLTVLPGFVDTPMTYGRVESRLTVSPERVARDICRAIDRRRSILYTPWFWRWIMLVIRLIPEPVFKRVDL